MGPFNSIPFQSFIQSLIGLVPKANSSDQTRLIFHLSYDFKSDGLKPVNHYTPKELCSVKYHDLDFAVRTYLQLLEDWENDDEQPFDRSKANSGRGSEHMTRPMLQDKWKAKFTECHQQVDGAESCRTIFAGKSDLRSAFRILGLRLKDWKWLVMRAQDPITNEWKYFVDKCLPFSSSISCSHFQRFSNALSHILQHKLHIPRRLTNYLDDFLFIAKTIMICNNMIQGFLDICGQLGVLVSMEKTEWASEMIVFLGILLDGKNHILALPEDKLRRATNLLSELITKIKATVKQLQQLCGFLNFICKAVFPGRAFTQQMYAKYSKVINIKAGQQSEQQPSHTFKWKQHHHVTLDKEFKADCKIWLKFLESGTAVYRPMVDLS